MSVQQDLHDCLKEAAEAAADGAVLEAAQIHDTPFREIEDDRDIIKGVFVGYATAAIAPNPGNDGVHRSDVVTTLHCYYAAGKDKTEQAVGRENAELLANAVTMQFFEDPSMGGRHQYCRVFAARDAFDDAGGRKYAVVVLGIVINETGALTQGELEGRAFR